MWARLSEAAPNQPETVAPAEPQSTPAAAYQPEIGDPVTLADGGRGTVIGVEDEGNGERRYTVAVEGSNGADERVDIFTIEDFVAPEPAPVQTPEPAAAPTSEQASAPTDAEASAPEQDTPVLTPPVTPPALPSPLERMPTTTDRRGRQTIDWTGADPALAWEAFVEQSGGDAEVARGAVDNMLRGAKNALKAAKKTKATDDVDRAIANETKRQEAIAEATRAVAAWEVIAAVGQREKQRALISQIIRVARKIKDRVERAVVAAVTTRQLKDLEEQGVNIDDSWVHSFETSAVIHNQKQHGNPNLEEKRGQIAITDEDYARIPEILVSYDKVTKSPNRSRSTGNEVLIYEKDFGDGYVYYPGRKTG